MKRRGFLALLGLAPVAPALVTQSVKAAPAVDLSAGSGGVATANFRMRSTAVPAGYRIAMETRTGGSMSATGLAIDFTNGVIRIS